MRRALAAAALVLALAAAPAAAQTAGLAPSAPGGTSATTATDPNALRVPADQVNPPVGYRLSARQAIAIADGVDKVRDERRRHPSLRPTAYLKGTNRWQISYFLPGPDRKELAQVLIDDPSGAVVEAWTGFQVAWTMARGYPGAFGRKVNAPWVWIPLCVLFVLPFVNPRRPWRLLHLDLLVIVAFSASLYFFNRAQIGISVPLVYPLLAYLLVRMLVAGFARRRARGDESLRLLVPASWLAVAVIFLLGFRVGLNVTNSNVIDVGYAGVIGADRLVDGKPLYGNYPTDNQHGDTYGPVVYEAYIPAEQALPWSGRWDDLPASHAAAIAFDLLTALGLWLLGRRIRGPTLGTVLAYGWVTCPFTLFVLNTNSNDSLVALLVVAALLLAARPAARGASAALAGLTKFAPLALAPLLATYPGDAPPGRPARRTLRIGSFAVAFAGVAALAMLPVIVHGDFSTFWKHTIVFQNDRGSPFSVWGFYGGLGGPQAAVKIGAVALALLLAFVPRERDIVQLAALAAAVVIALQLGVTHWFYLYIVWFLPLVLVALFGAYREPVSGRPEPAEAPARSRPRAAAVTPG